MSLTPARIARLYGVPLRLVLPTNTQGLLNKQHRKLRPPKPFGLTRTF